MDSRVRGYEMPGMATVWFFKKKAGNQLQQTGVICQSASFHRFPFQR
jgi:hypothetical protein